MACSSRQDWRKIIFNGWSDPRSAFNSISVFNINNGKSVQLEAFARDEKGDLSRAYQSNRRSYRCMSALDEDGCFLGGKNTCPYRIDILKTRSKDSYNTWVFDDDSSCIYHSPQCPDIRNLSVGCGAEVFMECLEQEKLDPGKIKVSQVSPLLSKKGISIPHEKESKERYQLKYRLVNKIKEDHTEDGKKKGYGLLEDFLYAFKQLNPRSISDFEVKTIDGKRYFSRAFLMCYQFAEVFLRSRIRFAAIDAGKLY